MKNQENPLCSLFKGPHYGGGIVFTVYRMLGIWQSVRKTNIEKIQCLLETKCVQFCSQDVSIKKASTKVQAGKVRDVY